MSDRLARSYWLIFYPVESENNMDTYNGLASRVRTRVYCKSSTIVAKSYNLMLANER